MGSLRKFYNEDAKSPICVLDELTMGGKYTIPELSKFLTEKVKESGKVEEADLNGYINVGDKFITEEPTITYNLERAKTDSDGKVTDDAVRGAVEFKLGNEVGKDIKPYTIEAYNYTFKMGKYEPAPSELKDWKDTVEKIAGMKLSELTILNSTDYLRAIYDFDELVDGPILDPTGYKDDEDYLNGDIWAGKRQDAIQALIVNSIEKSARFKSRLRYLKKAQINIDRLDDAFADYLMVEPDKVDADQKQKIGEKYIDDLFKSYDDVGLLGAITFV